MSLKSNAIFSKKVKVPSFEEFSSKLYSELCKIKIQGSYNENSLNFLFNTSPEIYQKQSICIKKLKIINDNLIHKNICSITNPKIDIKENVGNENSHDSFILDPMDFNSDYKNHFLNFKLFKNIGQFFLNLNLEEKILLNLNFISYQSNLLNFLLLNNYSIFENNFMKKKDLINELLQNKNKSISCFPNISNKIEFLKTNSKKKNLRLKNIKKIRNKCQKCGAMKTPEWRRGPDGPRTLCNACGLFYAKLIKEKKNIIQEKKIQDK